MKKTIILIIGIIISLSFITFSYAMIFNKYLEDNGTKQIVTIPSGKSMVFSLSKQIDSINFSKDSGFTIRTLEGGKWIDMTDNVADYIPMKGYMVRNLSEGTLNIEMKLKNITDINETIFQKTLKAGWNLVGPAYKNDKAGLVKSLDAFGNSSYSHIADYTGDGFISIDNSKINRNTISGEIEIIEKTDNFINPTVKKEKFQIKNKNELANIQFIEGLAYAVFVSNDTVIPGSQKITNEEKDKKSIDDLLEDLFSKESQTGSMNITNDATISSLLIFNELAGTSNIGLLSFGIKTEEIDLDIYQMSFIIRNENFSNNFKNLRLELFDSTYIYNGIASFDGKDTIITFEDFTLNKNTNYSNINLIADLEKYSTNGEDTAIKLGKCNIELNNIIFNNQNIFINFLDGNKHPIGKSEINHTTIISPIRVTYDIIEEINPNNKIAKIKLNIDKGNNILGNEKIKLLKISSEAIISSVINDNNEEKFLSQDKNISTLSEFEIKDGDKIKIKISKPEPKENGEGNEEFAYIDLIYQIDNEEFIVDGPALGEYGPNISISDNQIKLADKDIVLGNGVETVLYKSKLRAEGSDGVLKNYELIPNSSNSLSNGVKINDIIETAKLILGGEEYNGNITGSGITFNFNKTLKEGVDTELIIKATLKANDNIEDGNILSLGNSMSDLLTNIFGDDDKSKHTKNILRKPNINLSIIDNFSNGTGKIKITLDKKNNDISTKIKKLYFIESGNTEDSYKLYKEGDSSNYIESTNEGNKRIFDLNNFVYSIFDEITYVIEPKGTADKTYSLSANGKIAEYNILKENGDILYSKDKILNKTLELGTKTY